MNKTILTKNDYTKLSCLAQAVNRGTKKNSTSDLSARLQNAIVHNDDEVSTTIVRMQSSVTLTEIKTGESFNYRLVFPGEADISCGRLSVLSPIGAALLGRHAGETFSYESPGGTVRMYVEKIIHEN